MKGKIRNAKLLRLLLLFFFASGMFQLQKKHFCMNVFAEQSNWNKNLTCPGTCLLCQKGMNLVPTLHDDGKKIFSDLIPLQILKF